MDFLTCDPLVFFHNILNGLSSEKKKMLLNTFLSAIIIGFATHLFMFVNKLPNHDDVGLFYAYIDYTFQGRWFSLYASWLSGRYSTPIIIGTISIISIALSSCFIVLSLSIKRTYNAILISALMTTMPSVAWIFGYMYAADSFFIALLLACLAVYLTNRIPYGFICAAFLFAFSLGIYQMYYCFAIGLFAIILICTILEKDLPLQSILIYFYKIVASLLLGIILYYLILQIALNVKEITMTNYKGFDRIGSALLTQILKNLPSLMFRAIVEVKEYFFNWQNRVENMLLLFTMLTMLIFCFATKKLYLYKWKYFSLLSFLLLLPILVNSVFVISSGQPMYLITSYPLVLFYIFIIKLSETHHFLLIKNYIFKYIDCLIQWVVLITIILIIRSNYIFINQSYIKAHLGYEQLYSFTTRLISHVELLTAAENNPKVILIQNTQNTIINLNSAFSIPSEKPELLRGGLLDGQGMFDSYQYNIFIKYYLASKIEVVNLSPNQSPDKVDLYKKYSAHPEVAGMPRYPSKGSIKTIDGYIIVKLN